MSNKNFLLKSSCFSVIRFRRSSICCMNKYILIFWFCFEQRCRETTYEAFERQIFLGTYLIASCWFRLALCIILMMFKTINM